MDVRVFLWNNVSQQFDEVIDVRSPGEFAEDHLPGAINLPVLSDVWSSVHVVDNDALLSIAAPELEEVGVDLGISGNAALWALELASLESVGGSVEITNNAALLLSTWATSG